MYRSLARALFKAAGKYNKKYVFKIVYKINKMFKYPYLDLVLYCLYNLNQTMYFEKDDNYFIIIRSRQELSVIYGKTGGPGLVSIKKCNSFEDAELEYRIQVESKKAQGYKKINKKINLNEMELYNINNVYLAGSRYYENKAINEYWEIKLENIEIVIHKGKIGTKGSISKKSFSKNSDAEFEYELLIAQKVKQGFKEKKEKAALSAEKKVIGTPDFHTDMVIKPEASKDEILPVEYEVQPIEFPIFPEKIGKFNLDSSGKSYIEFDPPWPGGKLNGKVSLWRGFSTVKEIYKSYEMKFKTGFPCGKGKIWNNSPHSKYTFHLEKYFENKKLYKTVHYTDDKPFLTVFWNKGAYTKYEYHVIENVHEKKAARFNEIKGIENNLSTLKLFSNQHSPVLESKNEYNKVEQLIISCEKLTDISNVLIHFPSLRILKITESSIHFLPKEIANLKYLEVIDILSRSLIGLPREIGLLKNLEVLKLNTSIYGVIELPDTIGNLRNLKELYIASRYLDIIPNTIGNLNKLERLALSCSLWQIPGTIKYCRNLKYIFISKVPFGEYRFFSIPEELGELTELKSLSSFDFSIIPKLPESIGNLKKLEKLNIYRNFLPALPDSIGELSGLKQLIIKKNNLNSIPESIGNLSNLTTLVLSGNKITEFPIKDDNKLFKLGYIDLSHNQLKEFPNIPINSLGNLNLGLNKLTKVPLIDKLPSLTRIELHQNQITELTSYFKQYSRVKDINIRSNPITKVFPELYDIKSKNIKSILPHFIKKSDKDKLPIQWIRRFEKPQGNRFIFKEILQNDFIIGISDGSGFTKKIEEYYTLNEVQACCDNIISETLKDGYREVTDKIPNCGICSFHYPGLDETIKNLPSYFKKAFISLGITEPEKMVLPVKLVKALGTSSMGNFIACPNIPEYHLSNCLIFDGCDEDYTDYINNIEKYYWFDFDVTEADGAVIQLRLVFTLGDFDRNDGFWGAFWDRDTKELVANIISSGTYETTIKAVSEKHIKNYKPKCFPDALVNEVFKTLEFIYTFQFASEFEKALAAAVCLSYTYTHIDNYKEYSGWQPPGDRNTR